jgi:uracil DNA glycosylase
MDVNNPLKMVLIGIDPYPGDDQSGVETLGLFYSW